MSRDAVLLAGMQHAAGVIAARRRGDLDGATALLRAFTDDADCAHAFLLLTELALTIVAEETGQDLQTVVREVSLRIAALAAAVD